MPELEEFAESLLYQLSEEFNEEKEIGELSTKITEDPDYKIKFDSIEEASQKILPKTKEKLNEFVGMSVSPNIKLEYPELAEFKKLKGRKVFSNSESRQFVDELFEAVSKQSVDKIASLIKKDTPKYLVYSTYAKAYLSKISTTYGDYLEDTIYLNKFILSSYPDIILYKQGKPFDARFDTVNSGYQGALKMTILEESVHSLQDNLYQINKQAVVQVNEINEELAKIILDLDDSAVTKLTEYLNLEPVPDDFPIAKRANLFFTLNPDNFIVNVLGPDVMTYTHVEVDPKISESVPKLLDIYQRWLKPIQTHHAAFTAMEGMADFAVQNILKDDEDFQNYLTTFMGTDVSSYTVRKGMGKDFTKLLYEKFDKDAFKMLIEKPPTTKELKDPQLYLKKVSS